MSAGRPILRVGLTGGVASGKSTVARILAELGALVLDADEIAHRAIDPDGAAHEQVLARFGRGLLDEQGRVDRSRLARQVFRDATARRELNAIVHPVVRAEIDRGIADLARRSGPSIAVVDAALLVETGAYRDFHRLIVVRCDRATQLRRLVARDGASREDAEGRLEAQAPLEEKLAQADYVIDTETTLVQTRAQTQRVYANLLVDFQERFGGLKP